MITIIISVEQGCAASDFCGTRHAFLLQDFLLNRSSIAQHLLEIS